jgi:hypothetical protein
VDGVRLGLGALALFGAACRGAQADPTSGDDAAEAPLGPDEPRHGIDVPPEWTELPAVGHAAAGAARAAAPGVEAHGHAWGDPARGCYLAIVEVHGLRPDSIDHLRRELERSLTGRLDLGEWTSTPDAEDRAVLGASFSWRGPHAGDPRISGSFRAYLALDSRRIAHARAATCFYNEREPTLCDDACAPLLVMLTPLEPPSPP